MAQQTTSSRRSGPGRAPRSASRRGAASHESTPFSTDPGDELPVGLQLSWRLRALIRTGRLAAGERLPSFRRLAEWAGVNVNTVRAVYADLEQEGLVVSHQGQGTFVADGTAPAPELEQIATEALQRAREAGLSPRELAIVATACATMPADPEQSDFLPGLEESGDEIEVRHELRRQIGRLEAELATYIRDLPDDLPTAHRRAEAHIAGVGELEQTRDTLIAKLSEAQRAAALRAREEDEARAKLRRELDDSAAVERAEPGPGALGRAMSWWRGRA
ncbi:MAG TPA: GntR family transcriptional regulator [Solirubrobacterales bacterium]|nr:GntR family transcriptional regulator [Solirubrobacterales bacterium]